MTGGHEEKRRKTSPSPTRLGVNVDIPMDLTVEILKKLPTKSLVRFQCVSKLWSSIISSGRDFIESIVSRSLTDQPPRDVYLIDHYNSGKCFLASLSTSVEELTLLPEEILRDHQYVRGLICSQAFTSFPPAYDTGISRISIYNPTTRQSLYLPESKTMSEFMFGYDPLENQYKVLLIPLYGESKYFSQVFTLGDPAARQWRKIQGIGTACWWSLESVVCINGTIYYRHVSSTYDRLRSFDVRSEKFYHLDTPKKIQRYGHYSFPVNYQGKLGFICHEKGGMEVWVMETQWSKIISCEMDGFQELSLSGATRGGEIVFVDYPPCTYMKNDPLLRVYYYDPNRISMRYVRLKTYRYTDKNGSHIINLSINSIGAIRSVPDYVENTMSLQ